ncbi:MAG: chorismate mutase [Xenococcaceae cyanobacterium MO_207.B15]|nr:chorismate mutase [Xenococcaceae cyanobacterium MO_207.B15]MDJ0742995.1 chorismate mutase [Xenococcaceae cyanobacterium MO_167.B27]
MKQPQDCQNIKEIRVAIDSLERDIITKLGKRFEYVKAAAKFKNSKEDVKGVDRFNSMLQQRRVWAEENNLHPDVVEKLYRDLVNYFINEELQHWGKHTDEM